MRKPETKDVNKLQHFAFTLAALMILTQTRTGIIEHGTY